jgi:hypothetical protein
MSNLQNASLVLSTNNGISNTNKTSTTWNNINLRTLLGDMYDKYDLFNLCLNTVATGTALSNIYKNPADCNVIIRINGLPFINNTYNIGSSYNSLTPYCTIASFTFGYSTVISGSTFQGSIASNSSVLTVPSGTVLPIGATITFYDPNLVGWNTKTIISTATATTYNLNSVIGATAVTTTTITVLPITTATQYFYGSNIATFGKNQDITNITIDYIRISDLLQPETSGNNTFPNSTFIFDIFGIEKDKGNLNATRLEI